MDQMSVPFSVKLNMISSDVFDALMLYASKYYWICYKSVLSSTGENQFDETLFYLIHCGIKDRVVFRNDKAICLFKMYNVNFTKIAQFVFFSVI